MTAVSGEQKMVEKPGAERIIFSADISIIHYGHFKFCRGTGNLGFFSIRSRRWAHIQDFVYCYIRCASAGKHTFLDSCSCRPAFLQKRRGPEQFPHSNNDFRR